MTRPSGLLAGILLTITAGAILATMDMIGKILVGRLPAVEILWARYVFHTAIMLVWLSATSGTRFLHTKRPVLQVVRGLMLLVGSTMMYFSFSHVTLAAATAVQFFGPVLVTVWSVLFLGERIGLPRVLAVLAGFGGVVVIIQPGFGDLDPYLLLPLGTAFVVSVYFLLTRTLSGPDESKAALFHTTAAGAVLLSAAVFFVWETPYASEWVLMATLGGLGALGHFCIVAGFAFATAATLSPFLYSQVFFASLFSVAVIGDPLEANVIVGAIVLVASGIFIWWRENYGPRARESATAVSALRTGPVEARDQ